MRLWITKIDLIVEGTETGSYSMVSTLGQYLLMGEDQCWTLTYELDGAALVAPHHLLTWED